MARLPAVCTALAARIRTVIPSTVYPAPNAINGNHLWAVVYGHSGNLTAAGEQEWMETLRVGLYSGTADTPSSLAGMDAVIDPISDLFDPQVTSNHTLGGLVDFCKFASYELGQKMDYGGSIYYGGTLLFAIKRRRFAGDE
jgi:hypothetical protein